MEKSELEAKLAALEAVIAKGAAKKAEKAAEAFKKTQEKFNFVVSLDSRRDTDPSNWKCDNVVVCKCGFCGESFRRQPCDVHTAQLNGTGCCPECRKANKKEAKKQTQKELEAEITALKQLLAAQVNTEETTEEVAA